MVIAMIDGMPNSFLSVMQLAALLIFLVMTIAAFISIFISKINGLLNFSVQLSLLFFMLSFAREWIYPLIFDSVFDSMELYGQVMTTLCIASVAYGIDRLIGTFVWGAESFRGKQEAVPGILIHVVRGLIYLAALLIILQFVYGQSITALATLSGAAALVLGMSAQSTLGEMFAGLAISISHPFKVGDWVQVGSLEEGQVIDQTWRHVVIRTRNHSVININNSVIAGHPIRNFSSPTKEVRVSEKIYFVQSINPENIQQLLGDAIKNANLVLSDPPPKVLFRGAKDEKCEYEISYFIDDYGNMPTKSDGLWKVVMETITSNNLGAVARSS